MRNLKRLAIAMAVLIGLLAPLTSVSAQTVGQPVVTSYETEMAPAFPLSGAGVYAGTLRLSVSASGIVQGYYQRQDGGIEPVTGGRAGDAIWFSIGEAGTIHVNANVLGSSIVGSARDLHSTDTMSFTAKSSKQ